jgi:CRISPR-associated endoribonuclease Cas6
MRLQITAVCDAPCIIPYNYQYHLQGAIYSLIRKSDAAYSAFLHNQGYTRDQQYRYKLFTFSRLKVMPHRTNKQGYFLVKKVQFVFSTAINEQLEHLIHGIFPDAAIQLNFNSPVTLRVVHVEVMDPPVFTHEQQDFYCLSPIVTSTREPRGERFYKKYLNYFDPDENALWHKNLKANLLRKYELVHGHSLPEDVPFRFRFDADYATSAGRSVRKLVTLGKAKVVGLVAPFTLQCSPELKKLAWDAGIGEQNASGFGCINLAVTHRKKMENEEM